MSFSIEENTSAVEIREAGGAYQLFRNGKPFYVKGACGFENLDRLAELGANSVRTWGSDQTLPILGDLRRLGLTFCAGLWMEPVRRGFDYTDEDSARVQEERILDDVDRLLREPGLLLWAVGNELDLACDEPAVWDSVERIARAIKERDGAHPVITVISSPTLKTLRRIQERCPSLDALGVNSYADMRAIAPALREAGWSKPYLVTEWGSDGSWEVPKTPWGAPMEPPSCRKAEQMRERYSLIEQHRGRCLGSYAFFWGNKQETTPTWFNLFDRDGGEYEGVEILSAFWGADPDRERQSPRIETLFVDGQRDYASLAAGAEVDARAVVAAPEGSDWSLVWSILPETKEAHIGGDPENALRQVETGMVSTSECSIRFEVPAVKGAYRLYAYATDSEGRRASANIPFLAL